MSVQSSTEALRGKHCADESTFAKYGTLSLLREISCMSSHFVVHEASKVDGDDDAVSHAAKAAIVQYKNWFKRSTARLFQGKKSVAPVSPED